MSVLYHVYAYVYECIQLLIITYNHSEFHNSELSSLLKQKLFIYHAMKIDGDERQMCIGFSILLVLLKSV